MHLSLRFLGSFEAQLNSEKTIESRAKRIEALLAFLATESDRAHRRERLVGLIFPETPDDQARTNLRQTLTRLRRAIDDREADPPFLLISRESTQFNPASNHFLDVAFFDHLLNGCHAHQPERNLDCQDCFQRLAEAVDLYRGPFLESFSLDDSAAFEEWVLIKRQQYHVEALSALQQLADHHERSGDYAVATDYVRHQLRLEPWKEDAHRQLMRMLAYQGQRTAALQQYLTLESMLREELGVEPLAETRSLYASIRAANDNRPYRLSPRNAAFVGRDEELALLNEYLTDPDKRLITLTGPGGSGKTAIATETGWRVARRFLGPFFHGVFFVPLAGIDSEHLEPSSGSSKFDPFITSVAEAIGFSFSGPRRPREQLARYLQDKSLLLIIDNVEHVIAKARPLIGDLLRQAPGIKILITSRERLGFNEEWVLEIEGLPYPGNGYLSVIAGRQHTDPVNLPAQYQAIALFESLGKRLVSDFSISDESDMTRANCPDTAVQRIAQLVQGSPLGIELAASWLRMLSCKEIAAEIENSLDFLSSTMHDLPDRHRSLRAVFDSSWQLLNAQQQQTLRRLSVFHGPFDRPAATATTGTSLATLSALVDHSMLHRQDLHIDDQTVGQYELLDTLRQYAAEKLETNDDEAGRIREQHAAFYLQFLHQQLEVLIGSNQHKAVAGISQNIREIRSAWRWSIQHQDISGLSRALEALGLFYYMRSWFAEGADLFGLAARELELRRNEPEVGMVWARLRARQGWFTFLLGRQQDGLNQLLESVELLRPVVDRINLAYSLNFTAAALTILGDYEGASSLCEEARAIYEQYQDAYGCAISNNILSQIAYQQGDYLKARHHCEESLAFEQELGNRWSIGFTLTNLGRVAFALEHYGEAHGYFQESLAIRQSLTDSRGQALCLRYLGETAQAQGKMDQAKRDFESSLSLFRNMGSQDETSATLNSLGHLALQREQYLEAQRYFTEALRIAKQAATMPRILEATISLAWLLAKKDPVESAQIAVTVQNNPAANRNSRKQAAKLLEDLRQTHTEELANAELTGKSFLDIDTLIDDLLSMFI